jgi:uncharacterized membrane protein
VSRTGRSRRDREPGGKLKAASDILKKPEYAFCVIALVFGILMLVFSLPFRGPDELIHFYRSYSISEGNVLCEVEKPPGSEGRKALESKWVGNEIPHSVQVTADRTVQKIDRLPINPKAIPSALNIPDRSSPRALVSYSMWSSIAMYSPLGYLPQAFGIALGRVFSLSPLLLLYLARLFNLLAFTALVFLAIRTTPVLRWTMVLLGVMPLTINLAASVSADAMAIGLSFLFTAYILRLAFSPEGDLITRRQLGLVLAMALLLALSKPPYFLLVLLFLLIPSRKLAGRKAYAASFAVITGATLAVVLLWSMLVRGAYVPRIESVAPGSQVTYILRNPFRYGWIMLRTAYTFKSFWPRMFVGGIGFLEVNLPLAFLVSYMVALPAAAVVDPVERTPSLREKGVSLGTFLLVAAVTLTTFYITWTPVGNRIIEGFQARYLLPIAPLALLVLAGSRFKLKREWLLPAAVWSYSTVSIAITMFYMIRTYY